ncbi:MAG: tRNA pseudouridine(38-40) synthase TruA [Acidiferrobacter sp.]
MSRFVLGVEYNGRMFSGWQSQDGVPTIQDAVETALARVANEPVRTVAAGRTDAGVHALGQVIHFDCDRPRTAEAFMRGGNVHVGPDIRFVWARSIADDFHARFAAEARTYRYVILNRSISPALWAGRASFEYRPLDVKRMQDAALPLLGRHNFSSYRAVACQARSPIRTVQMLQVVRQGPFVIITIEADAFLHHMVRNLAGVLVAIGCGARPVQWAAEVLAAQDRCVGGVTAPPDGLYFVTVRYPSRYALPILAADAWAYDDRDTTNEGQ